MAVRPEVDPVHHNIQELTFFLGKCLFSLVTLQEVKLKHFSNCEGIDYFLCLGVHSESVVEPCASDFTSNDSMAGGSIIPSN